MEQGTHRPTMSCSLPASVRITTSQHLYATSTKPRINLHKRSAQTEPRPLTEYASSNPAHDPVGDTDPIPAMIAQIKKTAPAVLLVALCACIMGVLGGACWPALFRVLAKPKRPPRTYLQARSTKVRHTENAMVVNGMCA